MTPESRVEEINSKLHGWAGYFNQGPVCGIYRAIQNYTERRLRIWLILKTAVDLHEFRSPRAFRRLEQNLWGSPSG